MKSYEAQTDNQKEIKNTIQDFLDNTLPVTEAVKSFEVVSMIEVDPVDTTKQKWIYKIFFLAE